MLTQEERQQEIQALTELVGAIAQELQATTGDHWTEYVAPGCERDRFWRTLRRHHDHLALGIKPDPYTGRIEIRGSFAGHYDRGIVQYIPWDRRIKSITVTDKKTAAQIAKDICKRLLPNWEALYSETCTRLEAARAHECKKEAVLERLANVMDGQNARISEHERKKYQYGGYNAKRYYKIDVVSDDRVELTLDLSPDDAVQILAVFKTITSESTV